MNEPAAPQSPAGAAGQNGTSNVPPVNPKRMVDKAIQVIRKPAVPYRDKPASRRFAKPLVFLVAMSLAASGATLAQEDWTIVVDGDETMVHAEEQGNRVLSDTRHLAEALGATVAVDDESRIINVTTGPARDIMEPAEVGRTYTVNVSGFDTYTFTYLGYDWHPSRCLESADGERISHCSHDEQPVPMMLVRYKLGNPNSEPLWVHTPHVEFYVETLNGPTQHELNFEMTAHTRQTELGVLLPGQELELLSVVDVSRNPPPVAVVAELQGGRMLRFDAGAIVNAPPLGSPLGPMISETADGRSLQPRSDAPAEQEQPVGGEVVKVYANRVTVHRETWDHAMNIDGCGDEVYLLLAYQLFDGATGELVSEDPALTQTRVYGDVNQFAGRVRAGSKSCFSVGSESQGGLQTGDSFEPGELLGTFYLKEGDKLLVGPSVWEWDGGSPSLLRYYDKMGQVFRGVQKVLHRVFENATGRNLPPIDLRDHIPALEPLLMLARHVMRLPSGAIGEARDRPIGLLDSGEDFGYLPTFIAIQGQAADVQSSRTSSIRYTDSERLQGDYTIDLRIVREPRAQQAGAE